MSDPRSRLADAFYQLAMEKRISSISVAEIAEAADLSRPTFYRYFEDKHQLAFYVYEQDYKMYTGKLEDHYNFHDAFGTAINIFTNRASFYKKMLKDDTYPDSFYAQFVAFSKDFTVQAIGQRRITKDQKILLDYWINNTASMIRNWINNDMKQSTEWLRDMCLRLMPKEIEELYLE